MLKKVEKTSRYSKVTKKVTSNIWELVERSLPLVLQGDEDHVWFIRVIYETVKQEMHFDVRKYKIIRTETREEYRYTGEGLIFNIEDWSKVLNPLIKLIQKHQ